MLASSMGIAWLVSDLVSSREVSLTRRTLLVSSLALCATAKQCEALLAWVLALQPSVFRLHLRVGPLLGNAIMIYTFACTGYVHARRRRRALTARMYLESAWASVCFIAPALGIVLILASTASLFILATLDRVAELVTDKHIGALRSKEGRLYGAVYATLMSVYVDVQRRCVSSEPLLPTDSGRVARGTRRIDARGWIVHGR